MSSGLPTFPDPPASLDDDFGRDLHTEHQVLNMGPSHPATHGTVKFLIELDGETIINLDIQVGNLGVIYLYLQGSVNSYTGRYEIISAKRTVISAITEYYFAGDVNR